MDSEITGSGLSDPVALFRGLDPPANLSLWFWRCWRVTDCTTNQFVVYLEMRRSADKLAKSRTVVVEGGGGEGAGCMPTTALFNQKLSLEVTNVRISHFRTSIQITIISSFR